MSDRCDRLESEDTNLYGANGGMPVSRCLKRDTLFDDNDLVNNARMDAAEMAGPKDEGWAEPYVRCLGGLGYVVLPWPAHLDPPHAASEAHLELKRPDISIELYIVADDVMRAMARALEYAGVIPPIGKPHERRA